MSKETTSLPLTSLDLRTERKGSDIIGLKNSTGAGIVCVCVGGGVLLIVAAVVEGGRAELAVACLAAQP